MENVMRWFQVGLIVFFWTGVLSETFHGSAGVALCITMRMPHDAAHDDQ
jgi:hypothetical protein